MVREIVAGLSLAVPAEAAVITNASFENGPANPWPGYGPASSWTSSGTTDTNDASGPFTNGLTIPDGDQVGRIVKWKGGSDVSKLAGKPVRLRFVMKDADLYAIRLRP